MQDCLDVVFSYHGRDGFAVSQISVLQGTPLDGRPVAAAEIVEHDRQKSCLGQRLT